MREEPRADFDEDWGWIERFQNGETAAFNFIFDKYKSKVLGLAYRFVGQREAAEDIAQDVFIKIFEKKVKVTASAKFSTWLYRVTVNSALDVVRRRKFLKFSLDDAKEGKDSSQNAPVDQLADPASISPDRAAADEEIKALLQKEINALPEKLKVPILLYQFQNTPYDEIAAILGVSKKAVERRISHAKERLRQKLSGFFK